MVKKEANVCFYWVSLCWLLANLWPLFCAQFDKMGGLVHGACTRYMPSTGTLISCTVGKNAFIYNKNVCSHEGNINAVKLE